MTRRSTDVAILGAGPAGLLLSWALRLYGVSSIVVERASQAHVLNRQRAGVLEQSSVETLTHFGLGSRIATEGVVHSGVNLQADGRRHRIDCAGLVGRSITLYSQRDVMKDLSLAHTTNNTDIVYNATNVSVHGLGAAHPEVCLTTSRGDMAISADFVVGADGFHGLSRTLLPISSGAGFHHTYPFAWLGILANVAPSSSELIYALHQDGFALHSMRSTEVSRFYLQIDPTDTIQHWPDDRVWEALATRLEVPGWSLRTGPITDKSIVPLRSYVAPTFVSQRLFLVGDAAHIVPATGAKGLNAAIADVRLLATAFADHYAGADECLTRYGATAMAHQWRIQQFSQGMTDLLHRPKGEFAYRNQLGRLDYLSRSPHAQRSFAEQYTGGASQPMGTEFALSLRRNSTGPQNNARILHR